MLGRQEIADAHHPRKLLVVLGLFNYLTCIPRTRTVLDIYCASQPSWNGAALRWGATQSQSRSCALPYPHFLITVLLHVTGQILLSWIIK